MHDHMSFGARGKGREGRDDLGSELHIEDFQGVRVEFDCDWNDR